MMSYMFSFTAITALKSSTGAIIATILGEYVTRVGMHLLRGPDVGDDYHKFHLAELPSLYVKMIASGAILFIFLTHAFHPIVGPRVQLTVTAAKILLLCCIPILALVMVLMGNVPTESKHAFSSFTALFDGTTKDVGQYALALYSGLWAFDGWDQCTFVTGELDDPARKVSLAVIASTEVVTLLFLSTVVSYFLVLPPGLVARTNSVALDFGIATFGSTGGVVFAALVAFSCFGALNGHMYTYSHLAAAAGREGYLPRQIGVQHTKFGTPLYAQMLTHTLTLLFVVFGSGFTSLVNFAGVCSWFWYGCTVTCVLVLRIQEPHLERPYRVWLSTPILFSFVAIFLLVMPVFSAPWEALAAFIFIISGMPLYLITHPQARRAAWSVFASSNAYAFKPIATSAGTTDAQNNIPMWELNESRTHSPSTT